MAKLKIMIGRKPKRILLWKTQPPLWNKKNCAHRTFETDRKLKILQIPAEITVTDGVALPTTDGAIPVSVEHFLYRWQKSINV